MQALVKEKLINMKIIEQEGSAGDKYKIKEA